MGPFFWLSGLPNVKIGQDGRKSKTYFCAVYHAYPKRASVWHLLAISKSPKLEKNILNSLLTPRTSPSIPINTTTFAYFNKIRQNENMRLSMVKMFLKTAHHMGEVFKQPKEQLFESPPLTSGHPKFWHSPSKTGPKSNFEGQYLGNGAKWTSKKLLLIMCNSSNWALLETQKKFH